jgi:hypothetical protein
MVYTAGNHVGDPFGTVQSEAQDASTESRGEQWSMVTVWRSLTIIISLQNAKKALDFIRSKDVRLTNIGSEGDPSAEME